MELFRVFDWDGSSLGEAEGGPLFVGRSHQGAGRHDNAGEFGAWYCSRVAVSAVAETIQYFRNRTLHDRDFTVPNGRAKSLVTLRLDDVIPIVDLDDPAELVARSIRPSQVATRRRVTTQRIATSLFKEGAGGLSWWSTFDAEWTNVTLFYERVRRHIVVASPPVMLSTRNADVRQAAAHLGIEI